MNDEQLEKMAREVDDILARLSIKYEAPPLILAYIIVARLMLMNDINMSGVDLRKLLEEVSTTETLYKETNTKELH